MTDASRTEVDSFLRGFRRGLATLPADIREDLVEEVRSHLEERLAQGKLDLAREFGSADDYAQRFLTELQLSAALSRGTPLRLFTVLVGRATATATVVFVLLPLLLVEISAGMLVSIGLLKPFAADHVGLFLSADGGLAGLGWLSRVDGLHEVLGYAAMPLFIFGGLLLFWLANRQLVRIARRELAELRKPI